MFFGSESSPTNWQVPLMENKNDISSKLSLTDGRSKQLMEHVDIVLNITFNTFDGSTQRNGQRNTKNETI